MVYRFSNRGSVLLMVVGLLTMIAMLGGTFLVVTHVDARSSEAMVAKGQADPLATGLVSNIAGKLLGALDIKDDARGPYSGQGGWRIYAQYPHDDVTQLLYYYHKDGGGNVTEHLSNLEGPDTDKVDTDGDGHPDAYLRPSAVTNPRGQGYYYGLKVTDLSGALNVNTGYQPEWTGGWSGVDLSVVNIDLRSHLSVFTNLHNERVGSSGAATPSQWLGDVAVRLLNPQANRRPFAIGDEMCLRWLGDGAMSETGRLWRVISALSSWDRTKLTTINISRSLMRHPAASFLCRIRPTQRDAGNTYPLDNESVRTRLRDELQSALAGGGGGGTSAPQTIIIDEGDPGFAKSGPYWMFFSPRADCYNQDYFMTDRVTGTHQATWTFSSVEVGSTCDLYTTWRPYPERATNATYTIYDGSTVVGTKVFNQRSGGGSQITTSLGTYVINNGSVVVKLTDAGADSKVCADAVKMIKSVPVVGPPPEAGPDAAHFIANLWASLKPFGGPDGATSKAFALPYTEGGVEKKVYGLVNQPFIVEAFAQHQRNSKDADGNSKNDYYWGCAIRLMNPSRHAISLSNYKITGLTATPAEKTLGAIPIDPNGGWVVLYDYGSGGPPNAPADPLDAQHLNFKQSNGDKWHQVVGLRFLSGTTLKLFRAAQGEDIPIDSVNSGPAGENTDLTYDYSKDIIDTTPSDEATPPTVKADIRRDDLVAHGRYSVAIYAPQKNSHALSSDTGMGVAGEIPTTTVTKGYNVDVPHLEIWPKCPGDLAELFVVGPRSDGSDLPHLLREYVKKANENANDDRTQDARAHLDFLGRAIGNADQYPDVPWGTLVGELFEFSRTDPVRTDDPHCSPGTTPGSRVYGRININTATPSVLQRLPWPSNAGDPAQAIKIGETTIPIFVAEIVNEIVSYREKTDRGTVGIANLRDDSKYGGFLTPGEIAVPLCKYMDQKIGPGLKDHQDYLKARNALYRTISNVITVNSDAFAVNIAIQLGKPARCRWYYVAVVDRSNCFRKDDYPAVLLFSQAR